MTFAHKIILIFVHNVTNSIVKFAPFASICGKKKPKWKKIDWNLNEFICSFFFYTVVWKWKLILFHERKSHKICSFCGIKNVILFSLTSRGQSPAELIWILIYVLPNNIIFLFIYINRNEYVIDHALRTQMYFCAYSPEIAKFTQNKNLASFEIYRSPKMIQFT